MTTVTSISEYRARDTVEVLEDLLAQAKAGKITGFAFACRLGPRDHGIGLTGEYRNDPVQVLAVTARIQHVVNELIDTRRSLAAVK